MIGYRSCIEPLTPYIPGKPIDEVKRELGLDEVVKLASNENPLGCSPKAVEAVIAAMDEANLYPDGNCTDLRAELAGKYGIAENRLVFGCGTDEIIAMAGKVFINPGDECITAETTFSQYAASVESMGGKMVYAKMKDHGYDLQAITAAITDRTKVIFIANPNNPTGTVHTDREQEEFLERVPPNVLVVFDEAYAEYTDSPDYPDTLKHLEEYNNVMLFKTFSKIYGLASLRIGYAIGAPEIITLFEKLRPPFNVSVPAQKAALAAVRDADFVKKSRDTNIAVRGYAYGELNRLGLSYIPTQANFIMAEIKRDSREAFADLMRKGYIIRPGAPLGMEGYIRVTLGTMEQMKGFFSALKELP